MHKETDFSKEKSLGFYYNSEKVLKLNVKKHNAILNEDKRFIKQSTKSCTRKLTSLKKNAWASNITQEKYLN